MLRILIILLMLAIPTLSLATDKVVTTQGSVFTVTQIVHSTDAVQTLPANVIITTGDNKAIAVYITCENANIRWTVGGVDPSPTSIALDGLGHILYSTQSLRIVNGDWIRSFRFISEALVTPAKIQITAEFDK